ncbi:MAG: PAS domain S-box protein [Dehalococcoidia bacterium]
MTSQPTYSSKKENGVYLGEDGILRIICIGDQEESSAREMMEETVRIANAAPGEIRVLFDTTRAGKFSVEARQAAVESLALALHSKAAVVAHTMPMRALGLIMVGGAKTPNMKVFETATEALEWLREHADHEIARGLRAALRRLWRGFVTLRWLRIKEGWLKEVFEVMGCVAMGDFSRRIAVSKHEDELALIEAGINLMADDLEDREREAKEYERRLEEYSQGLERKVAERTEELRESEARYRGLFESANDMIISADHDSNILDINKKAVELLGFSREELLKMNLFRDLVRPDSLEPAMECLRKVIEEGSASGVETVFATKKGEDIDLEISASAHYDGNGSFVGTTYILRDITERKKAKEEILRRNRELAALNAIAAVSSQSLDLKEVLNATLDKILEVMAAQGGTIYLLDERGEELVLAVHRGMPDEVVADASRIKVKSNANGQVTSSEELIKVGNLLDYASYYPTISVAQAQGPIPFASVALRAKGKWQGVLNVLSSAGNGFGTEEKLLLLSIANQMAVAIENARLYEDGRKLAFMEERNRLARELHDSVSQLLFSVVLNSEAATALVEKDPPLAKTRMESVREIANEAQEQMRDLLTELRLGALEEGLIAALNICVRTFQARDGIETTFSVEGERPVAATIERELFRIVQEALNNIAKHSQASSAAVDLAIHPSFLRLRVEDNGIGFDTSKSRSGLGLSNMRERAESLHGWLTIESTQGKGTRITVEVPLEEGHG